MNKKILSAAVISALCANVIAEETYTTGTIDVYSVAPLPGIGIEKSILPSIYSVYNWNTMIGFCCSYRLNRLYNLIPML